MNRMKLFVLWFCFTFLVLTSSASADGNKGIVSFTFDDGWTSQFEIAFPVMDSYGFRGSAYIYTEPLKTKWAWKMFMRPEHIRVLVKHGWEIGSHTKTHSSLVSLNIEKQKEELLESREILEQYAEVETLSFPYRHFSDETLKLAEKYYSAFKGKGEKKINTKPFPKVLTDFEVNRDISLTDIEFLIKEAKEKNGWLILTFHQFDDPESQYSVSREIFAEICEMVKKSGLTVKTVREAINEDRGYHSRSQ